MSMESLLDLSTEWETLSFHVHPSSSMFKAKRRLGFFDPIAITLDDHDGEGGRRKLREVLSSHCDAGKSMCRLKKAV